MLGLCTIELPTRRSYRSTSFGRFHVTEHRHLQLKLFLVLFHHQCISEPMQIHRSTLKLYPVLRRHIGLTSYAAPRASWSVHKNVATSVRSYSDQHSNTNVYESISPLNAGQENVSEEAAPRRSDLPDGCVESQSPAGIPRIKTLAEVLQLLGLKSGTPSFLPESNTHVGTWLVSICCTLKKMQNGQKAHDIGISVFQLNKFKPEMMESDLLWWFYRFMTVNYQVSESRKPLDCAFLHGTAFTTSAQDLKKVEQNIWSDPGEILTAHLHPSTPRPHRIILVCDNPDTIFYRTKMAGMAGLATNESILAILSPIEVLRNVSPSASHVLFNMNAGISNEGENNEGNLAASNLLQVMAMASMEYAESGSVLHATNTKPEFRLPFPLTDRPRLFTRLPIVSDWVLERNAKTIADQVNRIANQRATIASIESRQSELLIGKQASIEDRDRKIAEQAQLIAQIEAEYASVEARDKKIAEQAELVAQKETEHAHLMSSLAQKEIEQARLTSMLAQKETEQARLTSMLAQKDMTIAEYQNTVARQSEFIASRQVSVPYGKSVSSMPTSSTKPEDDGARRSASQATVQAVVPTEENGQAAEESSLIRYTSRRRNDAARAETINSPESKTIEASSQRSDSRPNLIDLATNLNKRLTHQKSKGSLHSANLERGAVVKLIRLFEEKRDSHPLGGDVQMINKRLRDLTDIPLSPDFPNDKAPVKQSLTALTAYLKDLDVLCSQKAMEIVRQHLAVTGDIKDSSDSNLATFDAHSDLVPLVGSYHPVYDVCVTIDNIRSGIQGMERRFAKTGNERFTKQLPDRHAFHTELVNILKLLCSSPEERQNAYEQRTFRYLLPGKQTVDSPASEITEAESTSKKEGDNSIQGPASPESPGNLSERLKRRLEMFKPQGVDKVRTEYDRVTRLVKLLTEKRDIQLQGGDLQEIDASLRSLPNYLPGETNLTLSAQQTTTFEAFLRDLEGLCGQKVLEALQQHTGSNFQGPMDPGLAVLDANGNFAPLIHTDHPVYMLCIKIASTEAELHNRAVKNPGFNRSRLESRLAELKKSLRLLCSSREERQKAYDAMQGSRGRASRSTGRRLDQQLVSGSVAT